MDDLNRIYSNTDKTQEQKEQILEENQQIVNAFDKLELRYDGNIIVEDSNVSTSEKSLIIKYLINSSAFESRSIIEDDDIVNVNVHWNDYALPILRMWLFINRTDATWYRLPGESLNEPPTHNEFKE
jgi:hypothetical protein